MASDEGIRTKRAVFIGGLAQGVNETTLIQAFSAFGTAHDPGASHLTHWDVQETSSTCKYLQQRLMIPILQVAILLPFLRILFNNVGVTEVRHRGFAFVTFTSQADAQDAIDNMDMNELEGRVLKVSLARPLKGPVQGAGNRAGSSYIRFKCTRYLSSGLVWETEEWLQEHVKPLAESGGVQAVKLAAAQGQKPQESKDDEMEE